MYKIKRFSQTSNLLPKNLVSYDIDIEGDINNIKDKNKKDKAISILKDPSQYFGEIDKYEGNKISKLGGKYNIMGVEINDDYVSITVENSKTGMRFWELEIPLDKGDVEISAGD